MSWTRMILPAAVMLSSLAGCSPEAEVYRAKQFNPLARRRVAVLPFMPDYTGRLVPAGAVDLLTGGPGEKGEVFFRRAVVAGMRSGAYDVVEPAYVDALLEHADLHDAASSDFMRTPAADLGKLLHVDAVLVGRVTQWDILYLAGETRHKVECTIQLIDTRSGRVLVKSTARGSRGRGLTGGPTGIAPVIIEPIRGLGAKALLPLGREVAARLIEPLLPTEADRTAARELAPFLLFATHDQPLDKPLRSGQILTVLALGAPGMQATWALGSTGHVSSMVESEPGVYLGKFRFPEGLVLRDQVVSVELTNPQGFRSIHRVEHKPLSSAEE